MKPVSPSAATERARELLRRVRSIEIRAGHLVASALTGDYHSVFRGRGMDFDEVREHAPGDEVRRIDWNVTARAGRLFIKQFREERELTLVVAADISASAQFGSGSSSKRDLAAELAAVVAFSALQHRDRVGLALFSDRTELHVPPARGRRHLLRIVRDLLGHPPSRQGTDLGAALDFLNAALRRRAVLLLVSDFQCGPPQGARWQKLEHALRVTARHHDLVPVWVRDPREETLPDCGRLTLEDAESGELVEVNTGDRRVRERFASLALARAAAVRQLWRSAGLAGLEATVGRPYLPELRRFFESRAGRRRP